MKHYPIFLNLEDCPVLLVGAGSVSLQKLQGLLSSGARVHVVAPVGLPLFEEQAKAKIIRWSRRSYQARDLDGVRLVIAATDDGTLQKKIAAQARRRGIWVNVVDVPALCDFIAPAIVRRGEIQVAISTGGAAPAMAKFLRRKLETFLGPEYAQFVDMVKVLRPDILKLPRDRRASLWECIASDSFLEEIKIEGPKTAQTKLKKWIYTHRLRSGHGERGGTAANHGKSTL